MSSVVPLEEQSILTLGDILKDPQLFIPGLKIRDKEGKVIPFGQVITEEQRHLIDIFQNHDRIAVIKARQLGASTIFRSLFFWQAFTSPDPLHLGVFSNKLRSAANLLEIDKRFYNTLPRQLQRRANIKRDEILFETTGTKIGSFSAQGDSNDRGYTLQGAHLSEFAFYDNAQETLASILASTNNAKVVIESTPNYYGDALHQIAVDAQYNDSWRVVVAPWFNFPLYSKPAPINGFSLTADEHALIEQHQLSMDQLYWRRCKIEELKSFELFKREYPSTLKDAYTLGSNSFLETVHLDQLMRHPAKSVGLVHMFEPYDSQNRYAIGFDPAGGCGKDFSVATLVDKLTLSVVGIISSNKTHLRAFTERVIQLSKEYDAPIMFELNNHGSGVKEIFNSLGFTKYRSFQTNRKSKHQILDNLKSLVQDGSLGTIDNTTLLEMRSLVTDDRGNAPQAAKGHHDDRVVAFCLALWNVKDIMTPSSPYDMFFKPKARQNPKPLTKKSR